jgi:hypothetical protein
MMELLSGSDGVSFLWFSIASILPSVFLAHIGIHIYSLTTYPQHNPSLFQRPKYIYIRFAWQTGKWQMASLTCSWRASCVVLAVAHPCGHLQPIIYKNHVAAQTFGSLRQVWRAWTGRCIRPDTQTPMVWKRSPEPYPRRQ